MDQSENIAFLTSPSGVLAKVETLNESMFAFSKSAGVKDGWGVGTINHMTEEQNEIWADKVYGSLLARY